MGWPVQVHVHRGLGLTRRWAASGGWTQRDGTVNIYILSHSYLYGGPFGRVERQQLLHHVERLGGRALHQLLHVTGARHLWEHTKERADICVDKQVYIYAYLNKYIYMYIFMYMYIHIHRYISKTNKYAYIYSPASPRHGGATPVG